MAPAVTMHRFICLHARGRPEVDPMKRAMVIAMVVLLLSTGLAGIAAAGSGDESYHGEEGTQPAVGAGDSTGPGPPNTDAATGTGDRTRHKDR